MSYRHLQCNTCVKHLRDANILKGLPDDLTKWPPELQNDVKRSWRRWMLKHHPDISRYKVGSKEYKLVMEINNCMDMLVKEATCQGFVR